MSRVAAPGPLALASSQAGSPSMRAGASLGGDLLVLRVDLGARRLGVKDRRQDFSVIEHALRDLAVAVRRRIGARIGRRRSGGLAWRADAIDGFGRRVVGADVGRRAGCVAVGRRYSARNAG